VTEQARHVDGLSAKDKKNLRSAIRKVWQWSTPHRLVIKRCLLPNGFSKCEGCKKRCPRVYVDHIQRVGDVDDGYIRRMWTPSKNLQGLCKKCHDAKTAVERKEQRAMTMNELDFF
jgi:hypothetical protein